MLPDNPQSLHRPNPRRYSKPRPDPPAAYRQDGLRSSGNTTDKSGSTTNDVGEPSDRQYQENISIFSMSHYQSCRVQVLRSLAHWHGGTVRAVTHHYCRVDI